MSKVFVEVWDFPFAGTLLVEDLMSQFWGVVVWSEQEFDDGVGFSGSGWVSFVCL